MCADDRLRKTKEKPHNRSRVVKAALCATTYFAKMAPHLFACVSTVAAEISVAECKAAIEFEDITGSASHDSTYIRAHIML